jgi:hypothetical protein
VTEPPPSEQPVVGQGGDVPAAFAAVTPGQSADAAPAPSGPSGSPFPADRPEVAVGAAFAGGLVLALILKRLAR